MLLCHHAVTCSTDSAGGLLFCNTHTHTQLEALEANPRSELNGIMQKDFFIFSRQLWEGGKCLWGWAPASNAFRTQLTQRARQMSACLWLLGVQRWMIGF